MKNKQFGYWSAGIKYFIKNYGKYRSLKKVYVQKDFEEYLNGYIFEVLRSINVEVNISGEENILNEPCLYVFNHSSILDPYFIQSFISNNSYFMAGDFDYASRIPILKNFIKWCDIIFVNRTNNKKAIKSIEQGVQRLKSGKNLFIFPEGRLTIEFDKKYVVGPFRSGSFKVAQKAQVPVIPIAINGSNIQSSTRIIGKISSGKVDVIVGKPIIEFKNGAKTTEVSNICREEIIKMLSKLK